MTSFEIIKGMKKQEKRSFTHAGTVFQIKRITKDYFEMTSPSTKGWALRAITLNDIKRWCQKGIVVVEA